jgi:cation diffusion facilitator CzcD-associated flavoprotein CzcO
MQRRAEVAVVGAGAAGLVAARELLREGHAVAVFEKSGRVGGTWAYDPRADADPLGRDPGAPGAVHSSMYASLRTNLPREIMGFSGFPLEGRVFAGDPRTFPGHREMLAFLDAFAVDSGVAAHVRLGAEVLRVRPLCRGQAEQWTVAWRGEDGGVTEEAFDAVVVCSGHCSVPLVPEIRGAFFYLPFFLSPAKHLEFPGIFFPKQFFNSQKNIRGINNTIYRSISNNTQ